MSIEVRQCARQGCPGAATSSAHGYCHALCGALDQATARILARIDAIEHAGRHHRIPRAINELEWLEQIAQVVNAWRAETAERVSKNIEQQSKSKNAVVD